jgi:fumarate reductase flavoprotein subunit
MKSQNVVQRVAMLGVGVFVFLLTTMCKSPATEDQAKPGQDGVYSAVAQGRNGDVPVSVTISGGAIAQVELGAHIETSVYTDRAIPRLIAEIIKHNSYAVDAVAGATVTSSAIKYAVAEAVALAGGTDAYYGIKPAVVRGADETITVDVAVIGAGVSGIMAASNAADQGLKVALIEKTSVLGGCSLQSFATSAYGLKSAAGENTEELIRAKFEGWIQKEQYRVDAALLRAYLTNAGRAMDYLFDEGFFNVVNFFGNIMLMIMPYDERQPLFERMLQEKVAARGGSIFRETTAQSLLFHGEAVQGLVASRKDGSTLTVNAGAVVVATGGYGGNPQMVYETSGVRAEVGCLGSSVGEGITMSWDVGAKVPANLGGLQLHQTLATANVKGFDYFHMRFPMILSYLPSLLHISNKGVRFRNEEWVNNAVAASNSAAFTGSYTYVLVSQSTIDKLEQGGLVAMGTDNPPGMPPEYMPQFGVDTPWTDTNKVLDAMVAGQWGYTGTTIEELALNAGFDPQVFKETFDQYQAYCRAGKDDYFNKRPQYLVEYEYGPYYLVESSYNQLGTVTGLVVNAKLQVLDTEDNPIKGLYSCGADASSSLYNNMYTGTGDGIGWAITSGKLAGESSAAYVQNN